jgi:hypothetical protein
MSGAVPSGTGEGGKVPSKNGAKHDANVRKTGKTNLKAAAKHAKPGKGGKK